jgi:hypothetical protein
LGGGTGALEAAVHRGLQGGQVHGRDEAEPLPQVRLVVDAPDRVAAHRPGQRGVDLLLRVLPGRFEQRRDLARLVLPGQQPPRDEPVDPAAAVEVVRVRDAVVVLVGRAAVRERCDAQLLLHPARGPLRLEAQPAEHEADLVRPRLRVDRALRGDRVDDDAVLQAHAGGVLGQEQALLGLLLDGAPDLDGRGPLLGHRLRHRAPLRVSSVRPG